MGVELDLVAMITSLQFSVFLMLGCCPLTWIHNPKILNLSPSGQIRPWDGMGGAENSTHPSLGFSPYPADSGLAVSNWFHTHAWVSVGSGTVP